MLKVSLLRGLGLTENLRLQVQSLCTKWRPMMRTVLSRHPWRVPSVPRPGLLSNPRSKLETEPTLSMTTHTVQHPPINRVNGLHDISNKGMNMTMRATL